MPAWRVLEDSTRRVVMEEPNSSSPPRAHHSIAKICSGFHRRASLLHAFMVHRDKSPNSSQNLFFSPWSQFPMTTVFFLHRDAMPGCQEMGFCEKQNFHRSWTCPQQMETVQVLMVSKVYIQCESIFQPLKEATMKTTSQTEKLSFFWISKQSEEGITFS